MASMLAARKKHDEALAWLDRGIDLAGKAPFGRDSDYDLQSLRREILLKSGRRGDAIESAWTDFQKHPSLFRYDLLMKFVPKAERSKWHERAMEAASTADLRELMELLVETGELERLVALVQGTNDQELERLSHYITEPAAMKLEKSHSGLAARLWRAQGMRIVVAKKSRYYHAAVANLERAMECYRRAGLDKEWETTVKRIREDHHRKTGFMTGFERLVAGHGPSREPTFLERAKTRWNARRIEENDET
jgi:tetratricopeptide (TPR) repeat protein